MQSSTSIISEGKSKSTVDTQQSSDDFNYQFHSMTMSLENKGKFRTFYKVGHIISRSSIGALRKCLHVSTNQVRSVNFISKRIVTNKSKSNIMEELDKLNQLVHSSVAKSYEIFQDSKRYYIVVEYYFI